MAWTFGMSDFSRDDVGDLVFRQPVQFAVDSEQLQVERAFVFGDATEGAAVAQPHRDGPVRRCAAPADRGGRGRAAGVVQRL